MNHYYETNENYRNYVKFNKYEKIKITRPLHKGFIDECLHFNAYFYSGDNVKISGCIHFYVDYDTIIKITTLVEYKF